MPDQSVESPELSNLSLFDKYNQRVLLGEDGGIEYEVSNLLLLEQTDQIFQDVIEGGFAVINNETGVRQSMTAEEFRVDAESRRVLKFTANSGSKAVALLTVHIGVDQVSWVDREAVLTLQRQVDEQAPPLYIGTIVVDPEFSGIDRIGTKLASYALNEQIGLLFNQGVKSTVFFDCIWKNVPSVPRMVQMAINQIPGGREKLRLMEWSMENGKIEVRDFDSRNIESRATGYRYFAVVPA